MGEVREPLLSSAVLAAQTPTRATPEQLLSTAIAAISVGSGALAEVIEALPAPIYLTDARGWVTHFNSACIGFAGRQPIVGKDRWCVTWRLYDDAGNPLPHERCPMAVTIREERPIRGIVAVAERPDGSRVMFVPYPTPVFDAAGRLIGAVNLLLDVTDRRQSEDLLVQARRCRRLAQSIMDQRTVDTLLQMAAEYEQQSAVILGR